ncbi:MAG: hypothetical protein F7C32_03435 [Desulfurococcales archaeon]|nr:hypothetical protein [Desulfurococcales archaeon]
MMFRGKICRILTSDRVRKGEKEDLTLQYLEKLSEKLGLPYETIIVGNSLIEIRDTVAKSLLTDCKVVIVTGGTGPSSRDISVEAVKPFAEKEILGLGELHRLLSYNEGVKTSWLSRTTGYIHGKKLVIVMPGNPDAFRLLVEKMSELLTHILEQLEKGKH